jgi:hypothetical protein
MTSVDEYRISRLHCIACHPISQTFLDGIIGYSTRQCSGDVSDKGMVDVTASEFEYQLLLKHVASLHSVSYFQSPNKPNQGIQDDFKHHRGHPTHYGIFPHVSDRWPRSWVLAGSLDGSQGSWNELDCRNDNAQ